MGKVVLHSERIINHDYPFCRLQELANYYYVLFKLSPVTTNDIYINLLDGPQTNVDKRYKMNERC